MQGTRFSVLSVAGLVLLQACTLTTPTQPPLSPMATLSEPSNMPAAAPGAIYRPNASFDLFMDLRARSVGDILTVNLIERTNASNESSTNTSRGTEIDTGLPIIAGRSVTNGGTAILNNQVQADSSFSGEADTSQSNSLDGSITVHVVQRLANGNLLVQGQKWLTLNQGTEFIELTGIIRPVDIGPNNSVPSTKVAEARITYSGKGALAEANKPGWLSRFFNSPLMPF
ncbi:MAG: flagellar basal body L-ring protein FlgH [Gammaproteobacteria bacterium]|nr:flagellar basal body L-ring protein FlgH [Gammaproteobacteria bacterium]